jgi:hypothetical protein
MMDAVRQMVGVLVSRGKLHKVRLDPERGVL